MTARRYFYADYFFPRINTKQGCYSITDIAMGNVGRHWNGNMSTDFKSCQDKLRQSTIYKGWKTPRGLQR